MDMGRGRSGTLINTNSYLRILNRGWGGSSVVKGPAVHSWGSECGATCLQAQLCWGRTDRALGFTGQSALPDWRDTVLRNTINSMWEMTPKIILCFHTWHLRMHMYTATHTHTHTHLNVNVHTHKLDSGDHCRTRQLYQGLSNCTL